MSLKNSVTVSDRAFTEKEKNMKNYSSFRSSKQLFPLLKNISQISMIDSEKGKISSLVNLKKFKHHSIKDRQKISNISNLKVNFEWMDAKECLDKKLEKSVIPSLVLNNKSPMKKIVLKPLNQKDQENRSKSLNQSKNKKEDKENSIDLFSLSEKEIDRILFNDNYKSQKTTKNEDYSGLYKDSSQKYKDKFKQSLSFLDKKVIQNISKYFWNNPLIS